MPTGYTACIGDEKDISFENFVMRCARGMGACVTMRDDPWDSPIPEKFEPSTYHIPELQSAVDALCEATEMTEAQCWNKSRRDNCKNVKHAREEIKKDQALRTKYEAMLAKVNAWVPPSFDHIEFKNFMIQQITDSIKWDCDGDYHQRAAAAKPVPGKRYKKELLDTAIRDIIYHNKENKAEIKRAEDRTKWINRLRQSLKDQAAVVPVDANRNGEGYQG